MYNDKDIKHVVCFSWVLEWFNQKLKFKLIVFKLNKCLDFYVDMGAIDLVDKIKFFLL